MRSTLLLPVLLLVVGSAVAQSPSVDERLSDLERRTSLFVSGKAHMTSGFAALPDHLRTPACNAYSVDSDEKAISLFERGIASLEEVDAASGLDERQRSRLQAQKALVATLVPGIDCSKLP